MVEARFKPKWPCRALLKLWMAEPASRSLAGNAAFLGVGGEEGGEFKRTKLNN